MGSFNIWTFLLSCCILDGPVPARSGPPPRRKTRSPPMRRKARGGTARDSSQGKQSRQRRPEDRIDPSVLRSEPKTPPTPVVSTPTNRYQTTSNPEDDKVLTNEQVSDAQHQPALAGPSKSSLGSSSPNLRQAGGLSNQSTTQGTGLKRNDTPRPKRTHGPPPRSLYNFRRSKIPKPSSRSLRRERLKAIEEDSVEADIDNASVEAFAKMRAGSQSPQKKKKKKNHNGEQELCDRELEFGTNTGENEDEGLDSATREAIELAERSARGEKVGESSCGRAKK